MERGKVTAEITRGLGERVSLLCGDVDIAVMLLLLEKESGIHGLGGVLSFRSVQGRFEAGKGNSQGTRAKSTFMR